ncbi:MAG: hypothetical protein IMZ55_08670, partial [Acidobacteria bacterium]|nr:hypothetical protein [Acidobacteriota bacterium]
MLLLAGFSVLGAQRAEAHPQLQQQPPPADRATRTITAVRIRTPIVLDGRLDEEVWKIAGVATGFLQLNPDEG